VSSVSLYNTFNFSAASDTIFFSFVDIIDFTLQRRGDSPVLFFIAIQHGHCRKALWVIGFIGKLSIGVRQVKTNFNPDSKSRWQSLKILTKNLFHRHKPSDWWKWSMWWWNNGILRCRHHEINSNYGSQDDLCRDLNICLTFTYFAVCLYQGFRKLN
jgi:hypothetical protein